MTKAQILQDVSARHGFSVHELTVSRCREHKLVVARQELMFLLYQPRKFSFDRVGKFINRDHSTVFNGIRAHKARNGL